ncbi:AlpA family phage regulatory protein [Pseudodesulfovibrio cashew]|uniref:AlpA family phage regulatory protein n=1 Tax=Pseudodesulfovibrio cashew TaxID=2678688 RepID=A0A6I6JDF5_9BACT|nr:AlpA family phage regulatory protein [Pseudodesulfovibrio cashew]QGY39038.1 AlpA family phage regulatory protein [Pseudodesulfovibrio cashew]
MSEKQKESLLRISDVLERIPVSKSTWWAGVKHGIYPAGLKLGARCTVWRESDIDDLIDGLKRIAMGEYSEGDANE